MLTATYEHMQSYKQFIVVMKLIFTFFWRNIATAHSSSHCMHAWSIHRSESYDSIIVYIYPSDIQKPAQLYLDRILRYFDSIGKLPFT